MKNNSLDNFGKILIKEIRDKTINEYKALASGSVQAPRLKKLSRKIKSLSSDELIVVNDVVIEVIDDILFNFLNTLEEEEEILKLFYYDNKAIAHNVVQLSDGLAGELFTEDGWICKYSEYQTKDCIKSDDSILVL